MTGRGMSDFVSGGLYGLEPWKEEYSQHVNQSLAELSQKHRMIILFGVGLVTAIEIANRLSINVLLPDLQGNVAGSSDDVSWVIILYNLGFLCSLAISYWMTRVLGARRHLLLQPRVLRQPERSAVFAVHTASSFCSSRESSWVLAAEHSWFVQLFFSASCFPANHVLSPFPGSTWNSISLQSFIRLPWGGFLKCCIGTLPFYWTSPFSR
jgi:hypothetical protein